MRRMDKRGLLRMTNYLIFHNLPRVCINSYAMALRAKKRGRFGRAG